MADISGKGSSILRQLRWRAVLIAFAVDYGCSTALGIVAGLVAGFVYAAQGMPKEDIQNMLVSSELFVMTMLIGGSVFVVVGGFVAGRLAPQARFLNAGALALVDMLLALTYPAGVMSDKMWIAMLATPPCALFGAFVAGLFPNSGKLPPPMPGTM